MRFHSIHLSAAVASALAGSLLFGCATTPPQNTEYNQAQAAYAAASNDPRVAQAAPAQLQKASADLDQSTALRNKGAPQSEVSHYAYLAIQETAIAQQMADANASQAYVKQAGAQRNQMLLTASQQQTQQARMQAQTASAQAQQAQMAAQSAQAQAQAQQAQAQMAAQDAQAQAQQAQQQNAQLQQQLAALHAKQTNRGMVLTLGSVLFATNKADLKSGATQNLNKLAQFMQDNPKRNVMVEGYTDSTGAADYNMQLSQQRADVVKTALVSDSVDAQRIVTKGFGEQFPVAGNGTASGRQQNRRVEIVISDANGNFPHAR